MSDVKLYAMGQDEAAQVKEAMCAHFRLLPDKPSQSGVLYALAHPPSPGHAIVLASGVPLEGAALTKAGELVDAWVSKGYPVTWQLLTDDSRHAHMNYIQCGSGTNKAFGFAHEGYFWAWCEGKRTNAKYIDPAAVVAAINGVIARLEGGK